MTMLFTEQRCGWNIDHDIEMMPSCHNLLLGQQADGGGIFDVLSDEEECWMPESSGLSMEESPMREHGRAAHDEHGVDASQPAVEGHAPAR